MWAAFVVVLAATNAAAQSITPGLETEFSAIHNLGATAGRITQMAFAPGDNQHLYVATYGQGILRFDYDPFTLSPSISNGVQVVPSSITNIGGVNGSLGLAFHQDPVLGTVMYVAPAVPFVGGGGEDTLRAQHIVRLTDSDSNGTWGSAGDVNQAIVDNLEVTELHEINQMQVRGNSLYVGVGSRTQNGGITTPWQGDQSDPGETAYTGAVNFIEDLTLLSDDTATPNIAGFSIANHKTDTQSLTSTDPGKLRVYSTGLRNVYGLRMSPEGELWLTFNQNESPQLPDEMHQTFYQADHGFEKRNDLVGDWKGGVSAESQIAIDEGYFQQHVEPHALLGNNAATGGFDFITESATRAGDMVVSRWARNDVVLVDRETGDVQTLATGISRPLEVLRDPLGNLLVGENVGAGRILRIDVVKGSTPLVIDVDRNSGEVVLRNDSDQALGFDGYTLTSDGQSLVPGAWSSLADSGLLGAGWRESPSSSSRLSELKEEDLGMLEVGAQVSIGRIFSSASPTFGENKEDLFFRYATPEGDFAATINYTGTRMNTLLLEVDPTTGQGRLRNTSDHTVAIDGYTIVSTAGASLDPSGWNSLDDQEAAGGDWSASPGTSQRLSELKETGATVLAPGALYDLGKLFVESAEEDLAFDFLLDGANASLTGRVLYQPLELLGDYNDNGIVDAADYTLWRDSLDTATFLPNDQTPGSVDASDYEVWKNNFGETLTMAGAGATGAVPEPSAALLLAFSFLICDVYRRELRLSAA